MNPEYNMSNVDGAHEKWNQGASDIFLSLNFDNNYYNWPMIPP